MKPSGTRLQLILESDACFGASRLSTVQDVDLCTQVDEMGFPIVGGRVVKGLIDEHVAVLLRALKDKAAAWEPHAREALGEPGRPAAGRLHVSDVHLPLWARREFVRAMPGGDPGLVTRALTTVRAQTRMDATRGTAADTSLRTTRVLRKDTEFLEGTLRFDEAPLDVAPAEPRAILVCALGLVRRGGVNRNRGWGRLRFKLDVEEATLTAWRKPLVDALRGVGQ
jgi:hypothetical protein